MVGVICFNKTRREKVKKILPDFLISFQLNYNQIRIRYRRDVKRSWYEDVRANRIWRMSCGYLGWDGEDATELFGIGKYGSDSYRIFYKDDRIIYRTANLKDMGGV